MPNVKISELPDSSAVSGAELVPLVQAGATKKLSVSQLLLPTQPALRLANGIAGAYGREPWENLYYRGVKPDIDSTSTPAGNTTALNDILTADLAGGTGRRYYLPPGLYSFAGKIMVNTPSEGLRFSGAGLDLSILQQTVSSEPIIEFAATNKDVVLEDLSFYGGTDQIRWSVGQAIRPKFGRLKMQSGTNCFVCEPECLGVLGWSADNIVFNQFLGHGIYWKRRASSPGNASNNVDLQNFWFQSNQCKSAMFLDDIGVGGLSNWRCQRWLLEGPHNANMAGFAPLVLGGITGLTFDGLHAADFEHVSGAADGLPIIKTVANANGAPRHLLIKDADITNNNGSFIQVPNSNVTAVGLDWQFGGWGAVTTPLLFADQQYTTSIRDFNFTGEWEIAELAGGPYWFNTKIQGRYTRNGIATAPLTTSDTGAAAKHLDCYGAGDRRLTVENVPAAGQTPHLVIQKDDDGSRHYLHINAAGNLVVSPA